MTDNYRKCLYFNECFREEIKKKKWKEHWRRYNGEWICEKHHAKLVSSPKYNKKNNDKWNKILRQRLITFLGKRILLTFNPRKGYCKTCSNNIFDGSSKITHLHHYFYVPIMVWACTIELCVGCHKNKHRKG